MDNTIMQPTRVGALHCSRVGGGPKETESSSLAVVFGPGLRKLVHSFSLFIGVEHWKNTHVNSEDVDLDLWGGVLR